MGQIQPRSLGTPQSVCDRHHRRDPGTRTWLQNHEIPKRTLGRGPANRCQDCRRRDQFSHLFLRKLISSATILAPICWSIEFNSDKPSENMVGRQIWDRTYNMPSEDAV